MCIFQCTMFFAKPEKLGGYRGINQFLGGKDDKSIVREKTRSFIFIYILTFFPSISNRVTNFFLKGRLTNISPPLKNKEGKQLFLLLSMGNCRFPERKKKFCQIAGEFCTQKLPVSLPPSFRSVARGRKCLLYPPSLSSPFCIKTAFCMGERRRRWRLQKWGVENRVDFCLRCRWLHFWESKKMERERLTSNMEYWI